MKYSGSISARQVGTRLPFILYSHTKGLVSEHPNLAEAQRHFLQEVHQASERGKDTDVMVFRWDGGHWILCGDLYEFEAARYIPHLVGRVPVARP